MGDAQWVRFKNILSNHFLPEAGATYAPNHLTQTDALGTKDGVPEGEMKESDAHNPRVGAGGSPPAHPGRETRLVWHLGMREDAHGLHWEVEASLCLSPHLVRVDHTREM